MRRVVALRRRSSSRARATPSATRIGSAATPSLDAQVRQAISGWGVVPILPRQRAGSRARRSRAVAVLRQGAERQPRRLVRDAVTVRSRARATDSRWRSAPVRRSPAARATLGTGRQFTPRNAPSLFNVALGSQLHVLGRTRVGRLRRAGPLPRRRPGVACRRDSRALLAAQAMLPVTNRVEMRGNAGDRDVFGNAERARADQRRPEQRDLGRRDAARARDLRRTRRSSRRRIRRCRRASSASSTRRTRSPRSRRGVHQDQHAHSTAISRATTTRCRPTRSAARCSSSGRRAARRVTTARCSARSSSRMPAFRRSGRERARSFRSMTAERTT